MSGPPTLTVVVPATNRPATLARCVSAIRAAGDAPEQLIVVEEPRRAGPARARNLGAARAEGDVLVFVDSDVVVHADAFRRIRAAFARDPELDAVFGSYDDGPEAPGAVSGFRNLLHHDVHQRSPGPAATFWAGLGAVRREAFERAGGFDEARFPAPSIEDVELGARLAATGSRIELDPGLLGTHLKAWTLPEMLRTDFASRGVPWVSLILDGRAPPAGVLNLGWRHRLSAVASLAGAWALVARRPRAAAAAVLALVALNGSFYRLLRERRGSAEAAAGVGLHALHHLTATAAVVAALVGRLLNGSSGR